MPLTRLLLDSNYLDDDENQSEEREDGRSELLLSMMVGWSSLCSSKHGKKRFRIPL